MHRAQRRRLAAGKSNYRQPARPCRSRQPPPTIDPRDPRCCLFLVAVAPAHGIRRHEVCGLNNVVDLRVRERSIDSLSAPRDCISTERYHALTSAVKRPTFNSPRLRTRRPPIEPPRVDVREPQLDELWCHHVGT